MTTIQVDLGLPKAIGRFTELGSLRKRTRRLAILVQPCAVSWVSVYDLHRDERLVQSIQDATLSRPGFGLDPRPALFGTAEWWQAVDDGRVPSRVEVGVVAKLCWGSMGDWPEWALRTDDGRESTWTRKGDHTRNVEGLKARARIVKVRWKSDSQQVLQFGDDPLHDKLIALDLEASDDRSDTVGPGFSG
jgi:hypothetical protein